MGFGKILVELRGDKTQEKVAKDLGIGTSTLGMYETEQRTPRDAIKIRISEYYNKPVQEIFFTEQCHEMRQIQTEEQQEVV